MNLNKPSAIIVGILTLVPWAYMIFFISFFMSKFRSPGGAVPDQFVGDFNTLFRYQALFMLYFVALLAFYITHLFRTERVRSDKKALWAVALFLGHFLAMPVYWWYYIRPPSPDAAA